MIAQNDTRKILNAFYRQRRKFFLVFTPILLAALFYVFSYATPEYESTARLLVKFGADARPEISQNGGGGDSSVDEHHELVQSNVNILNSRDLSEALLGNVTIPRAYPELLTETRKHGTLMDAAVKRFSDDLGIKTEAESDIISVSLYNPNPEVAQAMLRQLLDMYIAKQSEIYANPQTTILQEQAAAAKARLENAQKQLYQYKSSSGISAVDEELDLMLRQRSDLAETLRSKERTFSHYDETYNTDGTKAEDPEVQTIRNQIGGLDRKIAATTQHKSHNDDLMREIQIAETNYNAAELRAEEAAANQNLNQQKITRISIIEHPTLPYKAGRPWKAAILSLSLFAGLVLAFATCILSESMDHTFSLPEQASDALGVPVLASFAYRKQRKQRT